MRGIKPKAFADALNHLSDERRQKVPDV